jgi:hypothetical protein
MRIKMSNNLMFALFALLLLILCLFGLYMTNEAIDKIERKIEHIHQQQDSLSNGIRRIKTED